MIPPELPDPLRRHSGLIHKIASAYCRDAADRDEVVQEIAVQPWRSRDRYDPRFAESTWVYRIALNVAISWFRRERRHRSGRRNLDDFEPIAPAPREPSEAVQRLLRCIDALDAFDRALVVLHLDDQPHAAIAEVLGISATNVGTRLFRIKQRLRRTLSDSSAATKENDDGTR